MSDNPSKSSEVQSINNQGEWGAIRQNWAKEKAEIVQARATVFFDADDQVPLSKHFLLLAIALFFMIRTLPREGGDEPGI